MRVEKVSRDEWNKIAENAHLTCFSEIRPAHLNTFNFALVVTDGDKLLCYATIIEMDAETAHMQHGGSFLSVGENDKSLAGGLKTTRGYHMMINYLKENYKLLTTQIMNTNIPMLKLALSAGFVIVGIDCHVDGVYCHLFNDFDQKETT